MQGKMYRGRSDAAALLHSAYSDHQIGTFENLDQPAKDTLIVVRSRLKVLLQYALRFANGLKSQLLISHRFPPKVFDHGVSTRCLRGPCLISFHYRAPPRFETIGVGCPRV